MAVDIYASHWVLILQMYIMNIVANMNQVFIENVNGNVNAFTE